ncbi:hypothetical protein ACFOHM_17695, partial [Microbaculum marinum]
MSDARYPKRSGPGDYDDLVDAPRDAASGQSGDPLAELARLIDEDPFADFHQRRREPSLAEEQTPARGAVRQPPEEVEPEPYAEAGYDAGASDPQAQAYREDAYAQPPATEDYDALEAPMYREPRAYDPAPEYPAAEDTAPEYPAPEYPAPEYPAAYDRPEEDYPPQDAAPEEPSASEEPSTYETPRYEPAAYRVAEDEPRIDEQSSFAAPVRDPQIYRDPGAYPADEAYDAAEGYDTDIAEGVGSDRLYADLAAATRRVEPTFERPAPVADAAEPPARYDPAADPDAGLAAGAARDDVTEFDFGDLSGRDTAGSVVDPRGLDEAVYADDIYERTDPVFDDSGHIPPYDGEGPDEQGGRGRGLFIVAGLVGLVVIGGAGALAYRGFGGEEATGPAPVIRADKSPSKVKPEPSDAEQAPQQGKLVYDRVSGDGGSEDARLVSREEPVADVGNRQVRVIDPNQGEGNGLRGTADAGDASLDSEDLPKRVRTVVVKPDGTIVGEIQPPKPAQPLQPSQVQPAPLPDDPGAAAPTADT